MDLRKALEPLSKVNGYLGAGVFTSTGEMLEGSAMVSGIHQELAGAAVNDTLLHAQEMTETIGMGHADFIQVDTEMGIVLARCFNNGATHFHTVLYIKKDGNIAMAKIMFKKAIEELSAQF